MASERYCIKSVTKQVDRQAHTKTSPTTSFFTIVFEGAQWFEKLLGCIYPHAHQILIAEGAVRIMSEIKGYYRSRDTTCEIVKKFPDPEGKIKFIQVERPWKDKVEMKNELLKLVTGDILWQIDVDEFYSAYDIERIRDVFGNNPEIDIVTFQANHFWKDEQHVITGGKWDIVWVRCWRNSKDVQPFRTHGWPYRDGKPYLPDSFPTIHLEEKIRQHYGYSQMDNERTMIDKVEFYIRRSTDARLKKVEQEDLELWLKKKT